MQPLSTASRNYDDIKDKYFTLFVPSPFIRPAVLFDSYEQATQQVLNTTLEEQKPPLEGEFFVLNVKEEVERYEKENSYGEDNFRDRQHFIDVIIFGDPE